MHSVNYSRWAEMFQVVFLGLLLYFYQFPPPPGYAVAWLAAAGVVMAVRAEHFTITEKVVWILIAAAFVIFEIRAIDKDHAEREELDAHIRWQDEFNRRQERRQFAELLRQGKELFNEERSSSRNTLAEMTGGDSFAYLELREMGSSDGNTLRGDLLQKGSYPVFNVQVTVTDIDLFSQLITQPGQEYKRAQTTYSVPFVRRGTFSTPLFTARVGPTVKSRSYGVFIVARNGVFTESLRLRRVEGH
jgi:hypothetical protein